VGAPLKRSVGLLLFNTVKPLLISLALFTLASAGSKESFHLKTLNTSKEVLVKTAVVQVDSRKRTFSVRVVIKNIGTKPIQGVRCEYVTQEDMNGDKLTSTTNGGVFWIKSLSPNTSREFILMDDQMLEEPRRLDHLEWWLRNVRNPNASVRLSQIQFSDDSLWDAPTAPIDPLSRHATQHSAEGDKSRK